VSVVNLKAIHFQTEVLSGSGRLAKANPGSTLSEVWEACHKNSPMTHFSGGSPCKPSGANVSPMISEVKCQAKVMGEEWLLLCLSVSNGA